MTSSFAPEEVKKQLMTLTVGFRTPITQLPDEHVSAMQAVVDAASAAIAALKSQGALLRTTGEHEVLTRTTQKDNLR